MDTEFALLVQNPDIEKSQRHQILEGPIRTFPGNASATQYFQAGIAKGRINGDHTAIIDEDHSYTFHELDQLSSKLAVSIWTELGEISTINPDGDIVIGLCLPPSKEIILSVFAILKLGAAYLPIDLHFPAERVKRIVENCRPVLIITDPNGPRLGEFNSGLNLTKVLDIDTLIMKVRGDKSADANWNLVKPVPGPDLMAERVAIVLYTSGSSGEPKGVRLTHRTIMHRLYWQWKQFPFRPNEQCCFKTAPTFIDSAAEIFAPLLQGYSITVFGKHITANPNILIQRIADNGITRLVLVPSLLRSILATTYLLGDVARKRLESIKLWICSGETLTKDLLINFFNTFSTGAKLCNFYGSTELMADVTFEVFTCQKDVEEKVDGGHTSIGLCVFNTIAYILDQNMNLCKEGQVGELYIAGHNLCSGYVGAADCENFLINPFTNTVGFNRLFRTGDYVRLKQTNPNAPGVLYFEGRLDSQIKVRGQRVDTGEIQAALAGLTDIIARVVVLVYHRDQDDQAIVAFVVPKTKEISETQIKMLMKTKLKPIELPKIRVIEEVPLMFNGKVNRQGLLRAYETWRMSRLNFQDWQSLSIPPEQYTGAIALIQTIAQVTGTSEHDIMKHLSESFYSLGGTSLNSILVILKLRFKGFQIGIENFVGAPTLRDIFPILQPLLPGAISDTLSDIDAFGRQNKYYSEPILDNSHKADVQHIIAQSFSRKGDYLGIYTDATYGEHISLIDGIWDTLVRAGYSFVVRCSSTKKLVGVAINFNLADEPANEVSGSLIPEFEFLEYIESKERDKLLEGGRRILHTQHMGTHEDVEESANVSLVLFMEEENIRLAKEQHFDGIMTVNVNPLTQQICQDLLDYEQLASYQVNTYVAEDGSRPFHFAPDSKVYFCCWKNLK